MKNKNISLLSKLCKCYTREQMLQEDEDGSSSSGSSLAAAVTSQVKATRRPSASCRVASAKCDTVYV